MYKKNIFEKTADLFDYNPAYLGRLLYCRIGTNFNLYIERRRLDKAKDMLVHEHGIAIN